MISCLIIFTEVISKFKLLKKSTHGPLINSLEVAIWNWMDAHPDEFGEIQVNFQTRSYEIFFCRCIKDNSKFVLMFRKCPTKNWRNTVKHFSIYWIRMQIRKKADHLYGLYNY